jgi:hypothetical protein
MEQSVYEKYTVSLINTFLHLALPNNQVCLKDVAFENTLGDTLLELSFSCTLFVSYGTLLLKYCVVYDKPSVF